MLNLTYHQFEFHLPALWTFSATSYGKGPVDGIGAAIKSRATRYLLNGTTERAFLSPEKFYQFTKIANDHQTMKGDLEPNRPIEVFFLEKVDVEKHLEQIMEPRWRYLPRKSWIEGIQSFHQFNPRGIGNIVCRRTSCTTDFQSFTVNPHAS